MEDEKVLQAYARRAAEYTAALGSIADMQAADRLHIENWAAQVDGPILDAGCGPGHWTDFLHRQGAEVSGIDLVPEFITIAQERFPDVSFQISSLEAIEVIDGSFSGVLAWYSLIHLAPAELPNALAELWRVLTTNGHLLIGFFDGVANETFEHQIVAAYFHSVDQMTDLLQEAGFEILDVEVRHDDGNKPHAAISAVVR